MTRMGYAVGRGMVLLAAALFAIALVVGFLPVHAKLLVYSPEGKRVSCGSALVPSSFYSGDDGCETPLLGRVGVVITSSLAGVIVGAFGLAIVNDTYRKI